MKLYDFVHYRPYLLATLNLKENGHGSRARLARHLRCQTSFVSQVLSEKSHLSLEHALKTSEFLKHNKDERKFFMLLVQKDKAGSRELEAYFEAQCQDLIQKRQVVKERIGVKDELGPDDQAIYYSSWMYGAVHILSALPGMNTKAKIAKHLHLSPAVVDKVLRFLINRQLVREEQGKLSIGLARLHLGTHSPFLIQHHTNWRTKVIATLGNPRENSLHYSALFGISHKDAQKIRTSMLKLLEEIEPVVQESQEEAPFAVLLDLFEV